MTDGVTGALRAAVSMTFTNSPGLLVHIFDSSVARACSRCSISARAASLRIGTSLDGSDGGSSGSGGVYSMCAARCAGGRTGSGSGCCH